MKLVATHSSTAQTAFLEISRGELIASQGDLTPECKETALRATVIAAAVIAVIAAIFYPWVLFALGTLLSVAMLVAIITTPAPDEPGAGASKADLIKNQTMFKRPGESPKEGSPRLDSKRPKNLDPLLRLPAPPIDSRTQAGNASSSAPPIVQHSSNETPSMRPPAKHAYVGFRTYPSEPAQVAFSAPALSPTNANGAQVASGSHVIPGGKQGMALPRDDQKAEALPQPDSNQGLSSSTAESTVSRGNVIPGMRGMTGKNNVIPGSGKKAT